jgi:ABC-type dipeptide/oligopeptide/nickel transport system ATPase component
MSDQIAVMQTGKFVETGAAQQVIAQPQHPYTRSLLAARPHRPAAGGPQADPAPPAPPTPQGVNP